MNEYITALLSDGFERQLYATSLQNLVDRDNKLRLNNFAYAMRELMRHVLHRLASDESVIQCAWYRNETNCPGKITRRQRAIYAVQGGLSAEYVKDVLGLETDTVHKALVKAIDSLSKFTHVDEAVFGLNDAEVNTRVSETEAAVAGLFSTIQSCRRQIIESLWEQIDETVIDESLRETLLAIDELATHHSIEEVYTDRIEITGITHEEIVFKATGLITAGLQWGSNSDVRRGDGAEASESFPFRCFLRSPVDDPSQVEAHEDGLLVDTSSWWDGYYDEEA